MMTRAQRVNSIRTKFLALEPLMTERLRRQWAASEAEALGRGGVAWVAEATGMSRTTITSGRSELRQNRAHPGQALAPDRIRTSGAGRPKLSQQDVTLLRDLQQLLDAATRGDPQSPLLWSCKSTRRLADELRRQGHQVSHATVDTLLVEMGYSLQSNRKTREGNQHPDRNAQFQHIAREVRKFQKRGQPAVSVDAKKRELVGDFKQSGREWHRQGQPEEVRAKDFPDPKLGKVSPEGVYDLARNEGWVSVGIDHDTAEFAGESLRRWWQSMGRRVYRDAQELLVTADAGGSSGYRSRLWKVVVQRLADELGLAITVCHFPPGTSKWNKIEHRLFCHITENWRSRPLRSRAVVVNLIAHTATRAGLTVQAELDTHTYPQGTRVSKQEMDSLDIRSDRFHGEWNYTIHPRHG